MKYYALPSFLLLASLITNAGPVFAQNDRGAYEKSSVACRAALTTPGAQISKLAMRLARAKDLELNLKTTALRQIQIEIDTLRKLHGAEVVAQIEALATQHQRTNDGLRGLNTLSTSASRAHEANHFLSWTFERKREFPHYTASAGYVISGRTGELIMPRHGGLEISDLHDWNSQPRSLRFYTVHQHSLLKLSSNQTSIVWERPDDSSVYRYFDHHNLVTGRSENSLSTCASLANLTTPGFFNDGTFGLFSYRSCILREKSAKVEIPFEPRFQLSDVLTKPTSDERFVTIRAHGGSDWASPLLGVFNRQSRAVIRPTSRQVFSPVFNPYLNEFYVIEKESGKRLGKIKRLDPKTGAIESSDFDAEIYFHLHRTGRDHLILAESFRNNSTGKQEHFLEILNLKTGKTSPIKGLSHYSRSGSKVIATQALGSQLVVGVSTGNRWSYDKYYLINVDTRTAIELNHLANRDIQQMAISHDGQKIWFVQAREGSLTVHELSAVPPR